MERITAKHRAQEARKVAALNRQGADAAERDTSLHDKDDISQGISRYPDLEHETNAYEPGRYHGRPVQRSLPIKLKGVDLPKIKLTTTLGVRPLCLWVT